MRERMQGMQVTRVCGKGERQSGGEGRGGQGEREGGRKGRGRELVRGKPDTVQHELQDQLNAITAQLQSLTPTSNGAQYDHIPIAPPLSQNLRVPPLGSLSSDQNGAGSSAGLASLDGAGKRQTRSRSRSKGMSRSSSVRDANLDASNVSDEVYECKWRCGFTGSFDSVSEHEDTCRFSRQSGKSNGQTGSRHPQSHRSQHPPPRRSSGRSKSPREAARHTTGHSKSPRMSHGTTGSRRLEKFDRFLEKV